jgi:hypothetical protein
MNEWFIWTLESRKNPKFDNKMVENNPKFSWVFQDIHLFGKSFFIDIQDEI